MAQCGSLSYRIRRTETNSAAKPDVVLNKGDINQDFGITLLGKRRKEYGEVFNENMLHLLENFSCPSVNPTDPIFLQNPDYTQSTVPQAFTNPVEGQLWHNSSNKRIYFWGQEEGTYKWIPLRKLGDVAGNSGQLQDGEIIPKPVSQLTGIPFEYDECSWNVSPAYYPEDIDYMECTTIENGSGDVEVRMVYRVKGSTNLTSGIVNYQIISIKDYLT